MIRVCTGWNESGWQAYGANFIATFKEHWPRDIDLVAYAEADRQLEVGACRSLWSCDGVEAFIKVHGAIPQHCGKAECPIHKGWRAKDHARGYTFRYDAVRFCRQLFIPEHAAIDMSDNDVLAWFDADVVSFAPVPASLISDLLGDADVCHIGRGSYHSEIGFWAVRLNHRSRAFLKGLADMYRTGEVFKLREWHSAYVFDSVLELLADKGLLNVKNITPNGHGHAWFQCELGRYTDHLKGPRKQIGQSPERLHK